MEGVNITKEQAVNFAEYIAFYYNPYIIGNDTIIYKSKIKENNLASTADIFEEFEEWLATHKNG